MTDDLSQLWTAVAHVARRRVAVLEAAVRAVELLSVDQPERCAHAVEEAHKLVGSLDSYGISGGSEVALQIAELLAEPAPDPYRARALVARLRALVGD